MSSLDRDRFLQLVRTAVAGDRWKIILAGYRGPASAQLQKVIVRPVRLASGRHWSFVYKHATRDVTKNFEPSSGWDLIEQGLGADFLNAHLFTESQTAELTIRPGHGARLSLRKSDEPPRESTDHNRKVQRLIDPKSPWLAALEVTMPDGRIRAGMESKFRQIHRFIELLEPLFQKVVPPIGRPLQVADMGCGKGYLTFALYEAFQPRFSSGFQVTGIESRDDLTALTSRVAEETGFAGLRFRKGTIANAEIPDPDVLVALHACDTATDDALARGVAARASLLVTAPCCHKEIRPQIRPPELLAPALRHGIQLERHAEWLTDSLRAEILEWAGYDARISEFISPEHTAKNTLLTAVRRPEHSPGDKAKKVEQIRAIFSSYGLQRQQLASLLRLPVR